MRLRRFLYFSGVLLLLLLAACNKQAEPLKETPNGNGEFSIPLLVATAATTASDKPDYAPGDIVTLTGTGWQANESIHIYAIDDTEFTWSHDSNPDPVADETGKFSYSFQLPYWFVATYTVTATGSLSGTATTTFTDASAGIDQCSNDPAPSPSTDGCTTNNKWVNGNLNQQDSVYLEGDSVPYRLKFLDLTTGPSNVHTVVIAWDTTEGGKHAIDYLTTFNRTVATANPCAGVSSCSGTPSTFPIPADPQITGAGVTPVAGNFTLYGGTIIGVGAYSYPKGEGFDGNKQSQIAITFTASIANPVLAWGGHIATRSDWGPDGSAGAISGSPYHMRLIELDGSGGNQDRSLSAEAVILPASVTVKKDATPDSSTSFGFTASPSPLVNFSLVDDGTAANTKVFGNIITFSRQGTFTATVNETSIPAGWGFDSVACGVTSANGGSTAITNSTVTITLKEGENWTCTYKNSQRNGTLTLLKNVINDNGGKAVDTDFTLTATNGTTTLTGTEGQPAITSASIAPGTYTLSETGPNGYISVNGWSCTEGTNSVTVTNNQVTLAAGKNYTCEITNNDKENFFQTKLIVKKVVMNLPGGTATPANFQIYVKSGDANVAGSPAAGSATGTEYTLANGPYTISEDPVIGYTQESIKCVDADNVEVSNSGSVTLNGGVITCTVTNAQDPAPSISLTKECPANAFAGDLVTYKFNITNTGNVDLSNVVLDDPAIGFSQTIPTLVVGASTPLETNAAGIQTNTATVTGTFAQTNVSAESSCSTTIHTPTVTKTATGSYTETHDWAITKVANPTSASGFIGGSAGSTTWTVNVTETETISDINVSGAITVNNPNPALDMTVNITDTLDDGTPVSLECNGTLTVPAGGSASCNYTAQPSNATATLNTAKVTLNGIEYPATAAVSFTPNVSGPTSVTVDDDRNSAFPQTISNSQEFTYSEDLMCSSDLSTYTNGVLTTTVNNTATLAETGQNASASVTVNCYAPLVSKDAATSLKRTYNWAIEKSVDKPTHELFTGQSGASTYTVKVTKTGSTDSDFAVSGTITVTNPNPNAAMDVSVADAISGATVTCAGTGTGALNVPAGGSNTCSYTAPLTSGDAGTNTATATLNSVPVSASAGYDFSSATITEVNPSVTVSDSVQGDLGTFTDTDSVSYDRTFTCDQDEGQHDNIATINETGQNASASVAVTCIPLGSITIVKNVDIGNGTFAFTSDFGVTSLTTTGGTASQTASDLIPSIPNALRTYTITENGLEPRYSFKKLECDDPDGGTAVSGATASIDLDPGENVICTYTNTRDTGSLKILKTLSNPDGAPVPATFKVNYDCGTGYTGQVDVAPGTNGATVNGIPTGNICTVTEVAPAVISNYTWGTITYSPASVEISTKDGIFDISVGNSITRDKGTIVIIKNAKVAQDASATFDFTTTGSSSSTGTSWPSSFTLSASTSSNTKTFTVDTGSYTVTEADKFGWTLTGIGGSSTDPLACTVTGTSSGTGSLDTRSVSITVKKGDTVTCVFENTANGTTRTQGFWSTHSPIAKVAWLGGTYAGKTYLGVAGVPGTATATTGDTMICGKTVTFEGLMAGFWSDVSRTSTGAKRSALGQARMQLLQQLLAAELNASIFKSVPSGGTAKFTEWENALCGTNTTAIKNAQQGAASFNTAGDSGTFTPGTSADSKNARSVADSAKTFWDFFN